MIHFVVGDKKKTNNINNYKMLRKFYTTYCVDLILSLYIIEYKINVSFKYQVKDGNCWNASILDNEKTNQCKICFL